MSACMHVAAICMSYQNLKTKGRQWLMVVAATMAVLTVLADDHRQLQHFRCEGVC